MYWESMSRCHPETNRVKGMAKRPILTNGTIVRASLADGQPGSRVRLGNQALSTSEGARRYVADYFATQLSRHDFGDYILTELAADFACALAHHLSAQPSPGGQEVLETVEELAELNRTCAALDPDYKGPTDAAVQAVITALAARQPVVVDLPESLHDRVEALREVAARQPVGEPVAWVNGRHLDECIAMPMIESNDDATVLNPRNIAASSRPDGYTDTPLYRHPAQAVDHQAALLAEERAHGDTIDQRDRCEEVADELADHIARITGVDIGEHSSANCPWQNAIEAAEEYKPAQAVGLGAVREALQAAEGLATVCASVDGYSREEVAASGRAMRQQFADALAKVDSQAVGNG